MAKRGRRGVGWSAAWQLSGPWPDRALCGVLADAAEEAGCPDKPALRLLRLYCWGRLPAWATRRIVRDCYAIVSAYVHGF